MSALLRRSAMRCLPCIGMVCILVFLSQPLFAEIPQLLNYQGRLLDTAGDPVVEGTYAITFSIYDADVEGTVLWTETHPAVLVSDGLFNILLGSVTPLPNAVFNDVTRYLGITVGSDAELAPRTRLISSPYAFHSSRADTGAVSLLAAESSVNSVAIQDGTIQFSDVARNGASDGQVMKWNGTQWTAASDEGANVSSGWMHDGNMIYLETLTDSVGIGTRYPRANLDVIGETRLANLHAGTTEIVSACIGVNNNLGITAARNAIGGGENNSVNEEASSYCTIAGGLGNTTGDRYGTVSGGANNSALGLTSTIGGGGYNTAEYLGTVGGGHNNSVLGYGGTIGGGVDNTTGRSDTQISPDYGTVGGGKQNTASGGASTIGGGWENSAPGHNATVPGGYMNDARGNSSFAAGRNAKANGFGSVVIAASVGFTDADSVISGMAGQMVLHATKGFYLTNLFETAPCCIEQRDFLTTSTGAFLTRGGVWTNVSDENCKENFLPVNSEELLERVADLPISRWNYKKEDPSISHIGPTSQDFYSLFGVGGDDKSISTIDPAGIALAAIQGLHEKTVALEKKSAEIDVLKREVAELSELVKRLAGEQKAAPSASDRAADGR